MSGESSPTESLQTIEVTGHGQGPKSTHVEAAGAEFVVGKEASPLDYLLGSLAACINVIGHLVARDHDVALDDLDVHVEGDIDPAKYRGEATAPRAGFQSIRVEVAADIDADDEELQAWMDEVAERCPVADNLRNGSALSVSVRHAG